MATQEQQLAIDYLVSKHKLPTGAAQGIVAGLSGESGVQLNTGARNKGDGKDGSDSVGIAQWNGKRATDGQRFLGKPLHEATGFEQLDYLMHELNTTESKAMNAMKAAKDVAGVTRAFVNKFERPADPNAGDVRVERYLSPLLGVKATEGFSPPASPEVSSYEAFQNKLKAQQEADKIDADREAEFQRRLAENEAKYNPQQLAFPTDTGNMFKDGFNSMSNAVAGLPSGLANVAGNLLNAVIPEGSSLVANKGSELKQFSNALDSVYNKEGFDAYDVTKFIGEVAPAVAVPIMRVAEAPAYANMLMNAGVQGAANYTMADDEYRKVAGGLGVAVPLLSPVVSKVASPIMDKIGEMTSAVKSGIGQKLTSATGIGMSPGEYLIENSGVRGAMEHIADADVSADVAKYFNKAARQTLPTGSTPTLNQAIAMANGADTTMNDFVGALASSDRGASIKNVLNNQFDQLKAIAEKGLAGDISGSTYSDVAETVAAPVRGVAALSDELINVADYNKMFKEMPKFSMNSNTPTAMREAYKANAFTTTGDKVVNNSQLQRTMKLIDGMDASKGAVPSKDIQMIRANLNSVISSTQDNQAKATAKAVKDVLDADLMSQNPLFKRTNDVYRAGKQGQASDFYHTVASNPDDVKLAQALIQPNKSQQILNYSRLMQTLKGKEIDELSKDAVNAIPRMKAAEVRERMFKNDAPRPSAIAEIDKRGLLKGVNYSAAKAFKDTADIINKGRKTGEVGSKTANVQALIKSVSGELSPTMLAGTLGIDMLGGSGVATAGLALSRVKGFMTKSLVDKLVEASVDPKLAAKYVDEYLAKYVEKEAGVIVKTAKAIAETMKNTPLPYAATINTMNANDYQETR